MQYRTITPLPLRPLSVLVGLALGAVACGGGSDAEPLARIGERTVDDAEFAAHLRLRSISPRGDEATQEALDEYLRREALTDAIEQTDVLDRELVEAELRAQRSEMLLSRYFERFLRTAVTDDAVRNYYESHASEYEDREVHVAHVLVRTNGRMSDAERQAARARIDEAHAALVAGRPFAEVAAQHSEDAVSSSRGGDLGWVREGAIDARFSERAFATEAGAFTEPFETPFGFHVVSVLEAPTTRRRALAAVEGDIRFQLRAEARAAETERLLGTVRISEREGGYRAPPATAEVPAVAARGAEEEASADLVGQPDEPAREEDTARD